MWRDFTCDVNLGPFFSEQIKFPQILKYGAMMANMVRFVRIVATEGIDVIVKVNDPMATS